MLSRIYFLFIFHFQEGNTKTPEEQMIEGIMTMGFERDQVISALKASNGNREQAIEFLLNVSVLKFSILLMKNNV